MHATDLTVAAVVHRNGRYLLVEERATNRIVISQPGGHIEDNESPEQAVVREVCEETGCTVAVDDMIGVYYWMHPDTGRKYLRIIYAADFVDIDESRELDDGILRTHWLSRDELETCRKRHRSPSVMRCVLDFEAGRRKSHSLLSGMIPIEYSVERVLARADQL